MGLRDVYFGLTCLVAYTAFYGAQATITRLFPGYGYILLVCIYFAMAIACFFNAFIIDKLALKWCFVFTLCMNTVWIGVLLANSLPVVIVFSVVSGASQSMLWVGKKYCCLFL
jgi:hypothetical protein